MDERSLLTLLQKRPNEGMKELMRQYMGYCYYIVRNKLAEFPQEDIEECVSDVFVDAYRYREKIDLEKGGFRVFLATLARRRAADCYRKKAENLPLHEEIQESPKEVSFEDREVLLQAIRSLGEPDEKNIDLEILLWLSDKNDCVCVRVKGEHSGPEGAAWLGKAEKSIGRRGIL